MIKLNLPTSNSVEIMERRFDESKCQFLKLA